MNLPFLDENTDRVHRIWKTYKHSAGKKKVKTIILKFKSWTFRQHFHNAKPKSWKNSKRKPAKQLFNVFVNLTKR